MKRYFVLTVVVLVLFCSCNKEGKSVELNSKNDITYLQGCSFKQEMYADIETERYRNNKVCILYPQFVDEDSGYINSLIKEEATTKFVEDYYRNEDGLLLEISYAITLKNDSLLSIVFFGTGYREGAAHPNRLFYTVNIDLKNCKKLVLKDIVENFEKLECIIQNKNFVFKMYDDSSTYEYFNVNELLCFEDIIKCDEYESQIYSYLKEDSLGISFPVSYAIGDHHEFELPHDELSDIIAEWILN